MNYKSMKRVGINDPIDGFTEEEKQIAFLLAENTVHSIYSKLPTARMKFIVAAHFELGYAQEDVASMLGIKQPSLRDEINLIQRVLTGKPYRPQRKKTEVKLEDVIKLLCYLKNN